MVTPEDTVRLDPERSQRTGPSGAPKTSLGTLHEELRLHQRILEGDQSALLEWLDLIGHVVYCIALRHTVDATAAEDLTTGVFVDLWRGPEGFHPAHGPVALQLIRRMAPKLAAPGNGQGPGP